MGPALAEKLEYTGPAKKERVADTNRYQYPAKRKRNRKKRQFKAQEHNRQERNRAVSSKHHIVKGKESRWARAAPCRKRGRSEREHGEERVDSTVKEGRFQGEKEEQARRASLEQVEGSMSR